MLFTRPTIFTLYFILIPREAASLIFTLSNLSIHASRLAVTFYLQIFDQMLQQIPVLTGDLILTEGLQGFKKRQRLQKSKRVYEYIAMQTNGRL